MKTHEEMVQIIFEEIVAEVDGCDDDIKQPCVEECECYAAAKRAVARIESD